jgi:hypothetical protein
MSKQSGKNTCQLTQKKLRIRVEKYIDSAFASASECKVVSTIGVFFGYLLSKVGSILLNLEER